MSNFFERLKSISKVQILAIVLIILGVVIMAFKVQGMSDFYKEVNYAVEHDFAAGNPSPELLRPWMTIRYISVAYAVPQEYLFDATRIQPKKENSMLALERLNQQMGLGQVGGQPALMKTVQGAILAYRANPVATGLIEQNVEGWMTVAYIANSIGVPAETILQEVGISPEGNAYKPLGFLSDEVNYPGGEDALVEAIQKIVAEQGVPLVIP